MSLAVELTGGAPWGFRLGGGADFGIPLEIAKIRKKSKADAAGLQEGDIVTSIDNIDVSKKSHGEAMTIIEAAGNTLRLRVNRSAASSTGPGISVPINKPVTLIVDSVDAGGSSRSHGSTTGIPIDIQLYQAPAAHLPSQAAAISPTPVPLIMSTSLRNPSSVYQANQPVGWRSETQSSSRSVSNEGERKVTIITQSSTVQSGPYSSFASPAPATHRVAQQQPHVRQFRPATAPQVQPQVSAPPPRNGISTHEPWTIELTSYSLPVSYKASIIKSPAFNVKKHDVKKVVWSPTVSIGSPSGERYQTTYYELDATPRASSQPPPDTPTLDSFDGNRREQQTQPQPQPQPQQPSYYIPEPPPLDGLLQSQAAPSKRRIPGMVNPLITEHGSNQGSIDNIVNRSSRKKVYSDSSFYDAPGMDYPTVDEQVEMCRKIAVLLDSDRNRESRGGRMFAKRKQTAEQWAIETSASQKPDVGMSWSYDGASDLESLPLFQFRNPEFGYNQVRHHPEPIKSHLSAEEVEKLKANERNLVKHDSLPPNLAFDVTSALTHSSGKGAKIFARRRERADKYIVDETNARKPGPLLVHQSSGLTPGPAASRLVVQTLAPGRAAMTPWEAALEGDIDRAFQHLSGYKKFEVFEVPVHSALSRPPSTMSRSLTTSVYTQSTAGPPLQGTDVGQTGAVAAGSKLRVNYKPYQPVPPPGAPSAAGLSRPSQSNVPAAAEVHPTPYAYQESVDRPDGAGVQRARSEPRVTTAGGYVISYPSYSAAPRPFERSYNVLPRGFAPANATGDGGGAWSAGQPLQMPVSMGGVSVF